MDIAGGWTFADLVRAPAIPPIEFRHRIAVVKPERSSGECRHPQSKSDGFHRPHNLGASNTVHLPSERPEYRTARGALLVEEIELLRLLERVAAQRRAVPLGGEIPHNFQFFSQK